MQIKSLIQLLDITAGINARPTGVNVYIGGHDFPHLYYEKFTFILGQKLALGVLVIYNTIITFVFTMEI